MKRRPICANVSVVVLAITLTSIILTVGYGNGRSYEARLGGGRALVSWGELPGRPLGPRAYLHGLAFIWHKRCCCSLLDASVS
jgi:hypothetical protein